MTATGRADAVRVAWRERCKRAIVSQFDAALAGGTPQARYICELGLPPERVFVPYDVVDNDFFARGSASARADPAAYSHLPGVKSGRPFFLASGRFIQRKNLEGLIEAYCDYRGVGDPDEAWNLVILGDGPRRAYLAALADRLAPPGTIVFAGYRQVEEVAAYYGLAGAFVHPATVDQWGLVVNEAMAAGLPVLVSTGAGAAEDLVIDGNNGFTFDPANPSALAAAMRRVSAPEIDRKAMGRQSRDRVSLWSLERFATGLWLAVEAGASTSRRGLSLRARVLISATQMAPGQALAWRSVEA